MLSKLSLVAFFAASVFAPALLADDQSILDVARQAPPEIFADAAIKLVERGQIPPGQRAGLLEEAFQAAKRAHEPVRLQAIPIAGTNTRAAMQDSAGILGLDTLSLQSRMVRLMMTVDGARAIELFQSIEHPALLARPCEDPMIADASAYYETAGMVAGNRPALLMLALGQANSPGELASFAKMLTADKALPDEDRRMIAGALALKMSTAAVDYRSFTMNAEELRAGLEAVAPTPQLEEAARKLATEQMSWPRCNEEFGNAGAFVEWFNKEFHGTLEPIREEETWTKKFLGTFRTERYFESAESKQVSDDFGKLRMTLGRPEWRGALSGFLKELSEWKPAGENIDAFHQKMTVLHGLFQLAPAGEDRDAVIARTIDYLRSSGMEREYPAEWLMQVRSFTNAATDRAKLLAAFRGSKDPGLEVFAELDAALPK
ncbi:MAG TPA: hypothetical protein VGG72_30640 [Bryobacteraceae bacterium]|jgi:hypothetical protein